jgi:cytochrome c oxidase accessory protein FixG
MADASTLQDGASTLRDRRRGPPPPVETHEYGPLYAGRAAIYPRAVTGRMRRIKWAALIVLLAIYYITPWLRWDRGPGAPDQAVLLDIEHRRAYLFGLEIWPQELYLLTGLLIAGAFGLFLATALLGRVWCGFACPQTVWTDLFMMIERRLQGDRNARLRLERQPWTAEKVLRKGGTHALWLLIAFLTGGVWITYFTDAPTVVQHFFTGQASLATYFFVGLFTTTTYVLGGLAREQVCLYMCPWPRFQAALTDEDSLVVTYQRWRGEPRGKHKAGQPWEGRGDCVDCTACVAVCPTGVDIREGYQLGCIGCGLCMDACDEIMDRVGRPRGLITIDSEFNQAARAAGAAPRLRLVRARTLAYAGIILLVGGLIMGALAARVSADLTVLHERSPLYVRLADGAIRNGYTVKLDNRRRQDREFELVAEGLGGAELAVVGLEPLAGRWLLPARADAVTTYRVYLRAPHPGTEESRIAFVATDRSSGERFREGTIFRSPP